MSGEHDHLADNIKALREARGLSQQQIAKLAGIPRATWTHLESGGANPTLAVLIKVANALQVRLDELLAAAAPARAPPQGEPSCRPASAARSRSASSCPSRCPASTSSAWCCRPARAWPASRTRPARASTSRASAAPSSSRSRGERYTLAEGDVVTFRGDQRHGYHNPGTTTRSRTR